MNKKIITVVTILILILVPAFAKASARGEKTIGVLAGFNTRNKAPIAGVAFTYSFSNYFRIAPNIRYIFRNKNEDTFIFAIDGHIPFTVSERRNLQIYPIAGLAYTSHSVHSTDDVSSRYFRFGGNIGAGANMDLNQTLRLALECRYTVIKNVPTANISFGICYRF